MNRYCAVVPVFNNGETVASVVSRVRRHIPEVIVVDDGSTDEGISAIEPFQTLTVMTHEQNRGKGAAVKTGLACARKLGFTHALQIDADDQHDVEDIPRFLEVSSSRPDAVIAGERIFDENTPSSSRIGRRFGMFWYRLETSGHPLADTQCGYRVYPLSLFQRIHPKENRMGFDVEVLVRAVWDETPVLGLETEVRYFPEEQRVTHFRPVLDNLLFSWLHCRLTIRGLGRSLFRPGRTAPVLGR